MNNILACDLHDYIEIACMFRYRVTITLKSGASFLGTAHNTLTNQEKQEYMILCPENTASPQHKILLTELSSMTVLNSSSRFSHVDFW